MDKKQLKLLPKKITDQLKKDELTDCINWIGTKHDGYGTVSFFSKSVRSHRLIWSLVNKQEIPSGMVIMHTCDNRACNNPKHLKLGTQKENMIDKVVKGRVPQAKINVNDVLAIRSSTLTHLKLSEIYGVSRVLITNIKNGKAWSHV